MIEQVIPEDVRQFILQNIDSIAQIEGLVLVRSTPKTEWSVDAIAQKLFIGQAEAVTLLKRLSARGFLGETGNETGLYRYMPASQDLDKMIEKTADIYTRYLIPVTHLIHSKPRVQEFADAFLIRKD
jgi:hypothetical protein